MQASNDQELAKLLKPALMEGLSIVAEDYIKQDIQDTINSEVVGGEMYVAGGVGSVSEAWVAATTSDGELGTAFVEYDNNLLSFGDGRHEGAFSGERIDNMMELLDEGAVGPLFGFDNPAMGHVGIWDRIIACWEKGMNSKIMSGLRASGLRVWWNFGGGKLK